MQDQTKIDHRAVEDFLYLEADLIDQWNLDGWLALYDKSARYLVPTPDIEPGASEAESLYYIADDWARMEARVHRLSKPNAHAEHPRSQTRHFISNLRIVANGAGEVNTSASFIVYRHQLGVTQSFVGRVSHRLKPAGESYLILEKRCELDGIRLDQGKISIIL